MEANCPKCRAPLSALLFMGEQRDGWVCKPCGAWYSDESLASRDPRPIAAVIGMGNAPELRCDGIWTPRAEVLCYKCHGPDFPRGRMTPDEMAVALTAAANADTDRAGTECEDCCRPIWVRADVADLHNLKLKLAGLPDEDPLGYGATMEQTGGLCCALRIELAKRNAAGAEVCIVTQNGGDGFEIGLYTMEDWQDYGGTDAIDYEEKPTAESAIEWLRGRLAQAGGDDGLRRRILTLQSAIIDYSADRVPLHVELIGEGRDEPSLKIAIPGTNRDGAELAIVCRDYDDSDTDWILCFYTRDGWRDGDDPLWAATHCTCAADVFHEILKQMARR